jgi:hypothetical protein
MADTDPVHAFVEAATHRRRGKAEAILATDAALADDPWAALADGPLRGWLEARCA